MGEDGAPGGAKALRVVIATDVQAVSDLQVLMGELAQGNEYGLEIAAVAREGTLVYSQAVEYGADVVLLSPNIPGYTPELVQRLLHHEERPILTVAVVPAVGDWAVTMEKAGAVGHLTTPLSRESIARLAAMLPPAIRDAYAYRTSDKYIPRISREVAQIVDRGGWRRQMVAFWSPAGGVGKTTLAANVAAALGVVANKTTLLVDADMNKGDAHLLFDLRAEDKNIYALAMQLQTFRGISAMDVKRYAVPYPKSNLSVLCGLPQTWMASESCLKDEAGIAFVRQLMELTEPANDFVVFDLGQSYNNPIHLAVLQRVDLIFLVVNSTVTTLHAGHKALGSLKQAGLLEGDRLRVVLNKYHKAHGIDRREVQEVLGGLPIFAEIAAEEDQEVVVALNDGMPLVLSNSKCRVALDMLQLAASLYPPLTQIRELQAGKRRGLLRSLLGG
jgi:Flp pilus assembly CpaE family ATPase